MKYLFASVASAVLIVAASPVFAGEGGTHTETTTEQKTITQDRNTTKTNTVHEKNAVEDVTHIKDVTRVHPRHHITDITRVLHHQKNVDTNEYATHKHVAPEQVVHTESTVHVGHAEQPREHTVTKYHDVYEDDYSTRVHEVTGSPVINKTIHKHIKDVTVQPVVHEHDVTRVVLDNVHHNRNEHEAVRVTGKAETIVKHKREDVDP